MPCMESLLHIGPLSLILKQNIGGKVHGASRDVSPVSNMAPLIPSHHSAIDSLYTESCSRVHELSAFQEGEERNL